MVAQAPPTLLYGPNLPELYLRTDGRGQAVRSRTNQHLVLTPEVFDRRDTVRMSSLLHQLDICRSELHAGRCQLLDAGQHTEPLMPLAQPNWDSPEGQALLDLCGSDPARQFLRAWVEMQWGDADGAPGADGSRFASVLERGMALGELASHLLHMPALVPEVWMNYFGPNKTLADEKHLAANPGRVDFLLLAEGQSIIIELDGPSHYCSWDPRDGSYSGPSEERYTRSLHRRRTMERRGFKVVVFSNQEVRQAMADPDDCMRLVWQLPGFVLPF